MFNENDKVVVHESRVPWHETTVGRIEKVCLPGELYLVRLADETLVKCLATDLEENIDAEEETTEEKVAVTEDDFFKAMMKLKTGQNIAIALEKKYPKLSREVRVPLGLFIIDLVTSELKDLNAVLFHSDND